MKKKLVVLFVLLVLVSGFSPVLALASSGGGSTCNGFGTQATGTGGSVTGNTWDFKGIVCRLEAILGALVPLLIGLGLVYFIWGVITYVIAADEEAKKSGRDRMIYGIIGFTVIIFVWGLVAILANTLGLSGATVTFPTITSTPTTTPTTTP